MIDWGNASAEDIIRKYMELTGGPVTPNAGGQLFQRMKDWGANFVAQNNRQPNREEWANFAAMAGGITPEQALSIYDQGVRYNQLTGQWAGEDMFNQLLYQTVPGYGQTPTLGREEFGENRRQFDVTQGNWGKTFDEAQRQYNVNSSGWLDGDPTLDREKTYADLFSRLSGPQDWVKYQMAQSGIPAGSLGQGGLAEVFNRTPAFGGTTPDPSNSWENKIAQLWDQTRQQPPAETTPAAPPVAANPSVEMPVQAPSAPPAAQPAPAPAAPAATPTWAPVADPYTKMAEWITEYKSLYQREPTRDEWGARMASLMGNTITKDQAASIWDQGQAYFQRTGKWADQTVFDQMLAGVRGQPQSPSPAPPPAAQPAAPQATFQDFTNYISTFKAQNNRDLTEQEWISWVGSNMGLSPAQAKWVRDQGIRSYNAGKGWPGEDVFGQLVDYARTSVPSGEPQSPSPAPPPAAQPPAPPTPTPTYSTQPVGTPIPGPTGTLAPGPQGTGKERMSSAQAGQNGLYPWQRGQESARTQLGGQAAGTAPGAADMWSQSRRGTGAPNIVPKPAVQPGMQPGVGGGTTPGQQPPSYLDLAQQLGRRLPTEINARDYYRYTPTQRAMQSSAWSAAGLDPEDMWQKTRAALPKGQANTRVRWG